MKVVLTIIIILVWLAIMATLIDIPDNKYESGGIRFLSVAGMIGASYGAYKLIQYIFRKE